MVIFHRHRGLWIFSSFCFIIFLFHLSGISYSQALSLDVQVNRQHITLDDQIVLTITISGKERDLPSPGVPNTFDGFNVVSGPNHSQQTNIDMVSGQTASTQIVQYVLLPERKGTFTIPSLSIIYQGKTIASKPIIIKVSDTPGQSGRRTGQGRTTQQRGNSQGQGKLSFFRLELSKKKVFVGEQLLLQYVLYTREKVRDLGFKNIPKLTGFWVEEIEMKDFAQAMTTIEGVKFNRVILKKQILFPTSSGQITIEPISLNLQVIVNRQNRRSRNSFFNDFFGSRTEAKYLNSRSLEIDILPLPDKGRPAKFNGLVGDYSAKSSINRRDVTKGDSITYTITISGKGNIQGIQEPAIKEIDGFKIYSPTVSKKVNKGRGTLSGRKSFEYILVPADEGELTIPSVPVCFFSPSAKSYKTINTKLMKINVLPSDKEMERPMVMLPNETVKSQVKLLGQDINFIKLTKEPIVNQDELLLAKPWFIAIQILPIILIALVAATKKKHEISMKDVAGTRYRKAMKGAQHHLKEAAKALKKSTSTEFFPALARSISTYLANRLNISAAGITSDQIRQLFEDKNIPLEHVNEILDILQQCDYARFAPEQAGIEDKQELLNKTKNCIGKLQKINLRKLLNIN